MQVSILNYLIATQSIFFMYKLIPQNYLIHFKKYNAEKVVYLWRYLTWALFLIWLSCFLASLALLPFSFLAYLVISFPWSKVSQSNACPTFY
jgi:hypothetical protein